MMLVTIISVSYNSEKTFSKTIESVLNQSYGNIEYIIIDGASSDRTVEIASSYQKFFDEREGRSLRIISEPDNGMYDALNKGAKIATGELVGQINSDDWYELDAVEKMVDLYIKNEYDVAWGNLNVIKPSGNMVKRAKIGKIWTSIGWCHPSMFSKREILLKYPYALESLYDDFEFITRVYLERKKICTFDFIVANYCFGGMSNKKSVKEVMMRIAARYHIYKKYGMSQLYWFYCVLMEMTKYIFS